MDRLENSVFVCQEYVAALVVIFILNFLEHRWPHWTGVESVKAVGTLVDQEEVDTAGNRRGNLTEQGVQQLVVEEAVCLNTFV